MQYSVLFFRDNREPKVIETSEARKLAEIDSLIAFCFGQVEAVDKEEATEKLKHELNKQLTKRGLSK